MKSDSAADILLNYLRDVIYGSSNAARDSAVLNINELPEDFRDLGRGIKFFAECVTDTMTLAKDMSKGVLNSELPPRDNEIAAPLKSLHASLKHLTWQTQQITHGDYNQRVNFMGEFSASFNKMIEQLAERDALLKTVNDVAAALLSANEDNPFEDLLAQSMELLGNCVEVDRVHIWRDGMAGDEKVLYHSFEWDNKNVDIKMRIPLNIHIPYNEFPKWEEIIYHGKIIHGPFSSIPGDVQSFFVKYDVKSIVIIPLFLHDKFWGVFTLDSCRIERTFSEEEIHILQSVGLMMINAVQRNEALRRINEEHEKTEKLAHWYHSILDAIPLPISITDKEMKWIFINMAVENFLGTKRKNILGKQCGNWGAHICGTDECGIACVKRGKKQTYFNQNGLSFKVDVETLKDISGETAGFIEIVQDVTEIEAMAKRQTEAEAASQAKSVFLANMSHEMRTPMNAILGITEIQLQNKNLKPELEEALGQIFESGDLLLNIINDLLDLSKIEAGKMELCPAKYDMPSLINDTVQLNCLRYESSPVEFNLQIDENTPHYLLGDELRIKQVLNNILSNAFKYTNKGKIDFSISCDIESKTDEYVTIVFCISDTGQGMTEEQNAALFEEYTRFNVEANRETIGTGLGMSITKRLVDLMNGSISVQSEQGKGSVFTVRLPQKRVDNSVCGPKLAEKLRNFRYQSKTISKKTQFIREYMPYGSVLVVDDVVSNIYVAKGMLSPYSLNIETVSSGFEAIKKIVEGKTYDIIFMDHMMPKMDGIETTKNLRGIGYKKPIIALTANALLGQEKIFLENGFDGFISKPIDSREMNHILNEFIRNKKPTDVVEAARLEQKVNKKGNVIAASYKKSIDNELTAAAVNDIENALSVLVELLPRIESGNADFELYTTTVHGMKSALANIEEKELSGTAFRLESAGDSKDISVILEETPGFISLLKLFLKEIRHNKKGGDASKELSKDDFDFLNIKLNEIKTACEKLDLKSAKSALNALKQKTWHGKINDVINELSVFLIRGEYLNAVFIIDKLKENGIISK